MQQPPPIDPNQPSLHFRRLTFLRGPNLWSRNPVMEVWVDLANLKDWSSELIPGFNDRYKAWLPTVIEHRCSEGVRGGFFHRLDRGTYLAHILEHTTLELQTLAGCNMGFGRAREMSEEGVYKVAIRYEEEYVAEQCLYASRDLLHACIYDQPFDVAEKVKQLHDLADRRCLGPSSKAILNAATSRNIPYRRLSQGSLVQLGQGFKQRRIWTAVTDKTASIAEAIASDKQMTRQLLSAVRVPVPEGRLVSDEEDAWIAAQEIRGPIVVKPRDANHGRGVFANLTEKSEVVAAFHQAKNEGSGVIVERFVPGIEHRVLVVGGRVVAATCGRPVCVVGDGKHTIQDLIKIQVNSDPRRGDDESQPLSPIEFDAALELLLRQQKMQLNSVPIAGAEIIIKRYDNLSEDVTDLVHPEVAHRVALAARTIGLDIAGIDLVLDDISKPIEEQRGAIVEVNAGPGLLMHLIPSVGQSRPVGEYIINHIFGTTDDARIPVACVTGTNGKTTVTRMLHHILSQTKPGVGLADSLGMKLGDWQIADGPSDNAPCARDIIANPDATAAVFEAGMDGILREGLGFDKCDVAIVTNLAQPDHLGGEFDIWNAEKLFAVKRTPVDVVMERGAAVLNAADPVVMEMKSLSKGDVILFALTADIESVVVHLGAGKRAVIVNENAIWLCSGKNREHLLDIGDIDVAIGGKVDYQLENVLAAVAAAWHLGVSGEQIVSAIRSFSNNQSLAELFTLKQVHSRQLLIARPSNTGSIDAIGKAFDKLVNGQPASRAIVFGCKPNSRNEDLAALATKLAEDFDSIYLYPEPGESSCQIAAIDFVAEAIATAHSRRRKLIHRCESVQAGLQAALRSDCVWITANTES